jgi:hypothetical protein
MNQSLLVRWLCRARVALVLSVLFSSGLWAQINFYGIGDLAGGVTNSQVRDATRVGGTIVAVGSGAQYATSNATAQGGDTPIKWVQGSGLSVLPEIATDSTNGIKFVAARVITPDGSVIGGSVHNSNSVQSREPAVWTSSGATLAASIGYLNGPPAANFNNGLINGLSSNGTVAYGATDDGNSLQIIRYTAGSKVGLGFLNSGDDTSQAQAHAVSSDGTVVLGVSNNSNNAVLSNGIVTGTQAFRYTYTGTTGNAPGGNMTALPLLVGGSWNMPVALTGDATKAFGVADSAGFANGQLVRWNLGASITADALGSPNTALTFSVLGGTTSDGSVIVGSWGNNSGNTGYFYNANGWFDFQTAMTNAGVNLTGWTLNGVEGISPDGTLVYGSGLHNGFNEGFVIDLPAGYLANVTAIPEPATVAGLMGLAAAGIVIGRRHQRKHPLVRG